MAIGVIHVTQNGNRNKMTLKTPASWHRDMWREGLPAGNGKIGALVYGNIADETIVINHCKLWHWGKRNELPDIHEALSETRKQLDKGNFWDANTISADLLKKKGYTARLASPCPLCDIKVIMDSKNAFHHYRRVLNMETGEVCVSWKEEDCEFTRKLFVSRADDMLVYKLTSNQRHLNANLFLQLHETYDKDTKKMREEQGSNLVEYADKNFIYYSARNEDGRDFGAVMKIVGDGDLATQDGRSISVKNGNEITVYCCFFVGGQRNTEFEKYKRKLEGWNDTYEACLKRHAKLHGALFHNVDIQIADQDLDKSNEELLFNAYEQTASNALIERMWRFGRYLMISGTAENGLPFPLYGLWPGKYRLPWSHNMANENIQMIYWHTMVGGLEYTMKTVLDYYWSLMDDFRQNARRLFGCSGIYIPAGTTPGMGYPNQIVPVILNWIGAAGWLCQHFYDYYKFTGDEEFLKEKILPFMYEAAQFYSDYIVMDEKGNCKIYPSVSPENTPKSLMPGDEYEHMAHPCPSAVNATMDFAIVKELFRNIIEASKITGMYQDKIKSWETILKAIPEYQKNADGDIKEWMHPDLTDRYTHRHLSHIYPVFPGKEYVVGRDDMDMPVGFELAVSKRTPDSQSGWSLAHMACIYARLEKPEKAIRCLDILTRSCVLKNLFTLHNDWRKMGLTLDGGESVPVQMDANMGIANAVQEMLLFVSDDFIKILPACPERFKKGAVKNLHFMTGLISFKWDILAGYFVCNIVSLRNTRLTIQLPKFFHRYAMNGHSIDGRTPGIALKAGERLCITAQTDKEEEETNLA